MMELEIQKAVYARLISTYDLNVPVYDHVPQDAAFPYIVIGDSTAIQWDTDDSLGTESTITIHVWSRFRGREEVKEIQGQIYDALHRHELDIDGCHTVTCEWEHADSFVDPDGITRHGVSRFRILAERE